RPAVLRQVRPGRGLAHRPEARVRRPLPLRGRADRERRSVQRRVQRRRLPVRPRAERGPPHRLTGRPPGEPPHNRTHPRTTDPAPRSVGATGTAHKTATHGPPPPRGPCHPCRSSPPTGEPGPAGLARGPHARTGSESTPAARRDG